MASLPNFDIVKLDYTEVQFAEVATQSVHTTIGDNSYYSYCISAKQLINKTFEI